MTISQKQLEANKKNAQKGGVKTTEGKAIVKYNALKHGMRLFPTIKSVKISSSQDGPFEDFISAEGSMTYMTRQRAGNTQIC